LPLIVTDLHKYSVPQILYSFSAKKKHYFITLCEWSGATMKYTTTHFKVKCKKKKGQIYPCA